jgi:Protein of unknown function (DUF3108)
MFHNYGMPNPRVNLSVFNKPVMFGTGFALLSILAHAIFVGWIGGSLAISNWSPPLRDNAMTVSLSTAPSVTAATSQALEPPKKVMPQPVREQRKIATSGAIKNQEPPLVVAKTSGEQESSTRNDVKDDARSQALPTEDVKAEVPPEPLPELKNDKASLNDQPLYPGGLGAIPIAGAFPYTFYYGDYSLDNALGSGSFIVESGEGKYRLVLIGKASGLTSLLFSGATYRSEGLFGDDGFAPQLYAEKSGNRAERVALADYSTKEVSFGDHKKPTLLGMQDRVSVIWQLGLVLRAKPELVESGKALPIPLMSTRGLDNALFVSQGVIDFDKRGVLVKAAHFKFKPANPQNKAQIDLWYDLNRLPQPLRVRWIDERGRTIDIFRDD